MIEVFDKKYKLIKDYKEAFNEEDFKNKVTEYFIDYDYIVGDISYDKLRLKGFTKKENKLNNKINDYERVDNYIKENCAYGCKYFILERQD